MAKGKRRAVVLDFDGTVLRKPNQSVFNLIQLYGGMSDRAKRKMAAVKSRYLEPAKAGQLTQEEERDWIMAEVAIWVEDKMTPRQVMQAMVHSQVRPHAAECLAWLKQRRVPVAIVSYGIKQFIWMVLHAHGLAHLVDQVYALTLRQDYRKGCYRGCQKDSVVLPSTKGTASRSFARKHSVPLDQLFAIGDSLGDRNIGHLPDNRIALAMNEGEAALLSPHFAKVMVTDSFKPAWNWLRHRIR